MKTKIDGNSVIFLSFLGHYPRTMCLSGRPSIFADVIVRLGVSVCLDMVSIETLDLDSSKPTLPKISFFVKISLTFVKVVSKCQKNLNSLKKLISTHQEI
jgi:hypothetical protein